MIERPTEQQATDPTSLMRERHSEATDQDCRYFEIWRKNVMHMLRN